jgi:hypothetical protein
MSFPLMDAPFPAVADCVGISTCCVKQKFRLAFSCTPFIMSTTSWKNRKNAETIEEPRSKLRGIFDCKEFCQFFDSLANPAVPPRRDGECARCCSSKRFTGLGEQQPSKDPIRVVILEEFL